MSRCIQLPKFTLKVTAYINETALTLSNYQAL